MYGGCGGNDNRYETKKDCEKQCVPDCRSLMAVGPCKAAISSYYYNVANHECEEFSYGGCGGNRNRYLTKSACEDACFVPDCTSPPVTGPCKALIPRFYYDAASNTCKSFNWGGCGGNQNKYLTNDECERACVKLPDCHSQPDPGICRAYLERFYYDPDLNKCVKFIYGGCGGNRNNYESLRDCQDTCVVAVDNCRCSCNY